MYRFKVLFQEPGCDLSQMDFGFFGQGFLLGEEYEYVLSTSQAYIKSDSSSLEK